MQHLSGWMCVMWMPGCPQQPGKPQWDISGKFVVVRWKKATGDAPVTHYIVQAKELSTGLSHISLSVCYASFQLQMKVGKCGLHILIICQLEVCFESFLY